MARPTRSSFCCPTCVRTRILFVSREGVATSPHHGVLVQRAHPPGLASTTFNELGEGAAAACKGGGVHSPVPGGLAELPLGASVHKLSRLHLALFALAAATVAQVAPARSPCATVATRRK